jgi:signal transduction histidine kinase/CheY-like chemotaxis protein/HPt (histidine-containing phosphotransfer) domain-containing protein
MSDRARSSRARSIERDHGVAPSDQRQRLFILLRGLRLGTAVVATVATVAVALLAIGMVSRGASELDPILTGAGIGALLSCVSIAVFVRWYVGRLVRGIEDGVQALETIARDALEAARLKSDFIANLSSELRTPMSGLLGMIELLLGEKMEPKQLRRVKTLRVSAKALLRVVNDVLDFSRIEARELVLHPRAIAPVAIVWEVVELFRAQAELQGLNISMEVKGSPPGFVRLDPDRLRQVLSTLVEGALKRTQKGRIKVRVGASPLGKGLSELEFSVADTGTAIPAESLTKLFEAFSQREGSLAERHDGTGLGLALTREIVTLMGGAIGATSDVGEGNVFTVKLACDDEAEDSLPPDSAHLVPARDRVRLKGRGRVLVAEDSPVNREVMVDFLSELECAADFVSNGLDAVDAVARHPYDAILMDCEMPELDGYEATRRIRSLASERRVPIVAITAHASEEERERARQAGMDAFLSKPVKLAELVELLHRLLPRELSPALAATRNERPALDSSVARAPAVVRAFLDQVPSELAELSQAVRASDATRAQALANRLTGTCLAFGAGRMARLSAALERLPEGAMTLCADLEAEFQVVAKAVQGRRNPSTPASPWNH